MEFTIQYTVLWGSPSCFADQGNISKISKGAREHEPIFGEQGNKLRGQKRGKQIYWQWNK